MGIGASLKAKLAPKVGCVDDSLLSLTRGPGRPAGQRSDAPPPRALAAPFFVTAEVAFAEDAALRSAGNPPPGALSGGRPQGVGAASERLPLREMSKMRCATPDLQHTHWPGVEPSWRAALCKEKKTEDVWQRHVSPHAEKADKHFLMFARVRPG